MSSQRVAKLSLVELLSAEKTTVCIVFRQWLNATTQ